MEIVLPNPPEDIFTIAMIVAGVIIVTMFTLGFIFAPEKQPMIEMVLNLSILVVTGASVIVLAITGMNKISYDNNYREVVQKTDPRVHVDFENSDSINLTEGSTTNMELIVTENNQTLSCVSRKTGSIHTIMCNDPSSNKIVTVEGAIKSLESSRK